MPKYYLYVLILTVTALASPVVGFATTHSEPCTNDLVPDGADFFAKAARANGIDVGGMDVSSCAKSAARGGCAYPEVRSNCCVTCAGTDAALSEASARKGGGGDDDDDGDGCTKTGRQCGDDKPVCCSGKCHVIWNFGWTVFGDCYD